VVGLSVDEVKPGANASDGLLRSRRTLLSSLTVNTLTPVALLRLRQDDSILEVSLCLLFVCIRGHFEGERVGTPFPLLKSCRNAWERRSHC